MSNVVQTIPLSHLVAKAGAAVYDSVKTSIANGTPIFSTADIRAPRLKICMSCDKFGVKIHTSNGIIRYVGCGQCHCVLTFKHMLANEHCPLGKW